MERIYSRPPRETYFKSIANENCISVTLWCVAFFCKWQFNEILVKYLNLSVFSAMLTQSVSKAQQFHKWYASQLLFSEFSIHMTNGKWCWSNGQIDRALFRVGNASGKSLHWKRVVKRTRWNIQYSYHKYWMLNTLGIDAWMLFSIWFGKCARK